MVGGFNYTSVEEHSPPSCKGDLSLLWLSCLLVLLLWHSPPSCKGDLSLLWLSCLLVLLLWHSPPSCKGDLSLLWLSCLLVLLLPNNFKLLGFQILTMSVHDKVYSRIVSCTLNLISKLLLGTDHLTSMGGGGYGFFLKNILIPNVAEKNIVILVEGK